MIWAINRQFFLCISLRGLMPNLCYELRVFVPHEPVSTDCWLDRIADSVESWCGRRSWQKHWQVVGHCPLRRRRTPDTALATRRVPSANSRSASDCQPLCTDAPATSFWTVSHMTSPTTSFASICSRCWSTERNVISCGAVSYTHLTLPTNREV